MVKLDHVTPAVRDWRASRDGYAKNLGLKVEFEVPHPGPSKWGVAAMQDDSGLTLFLEQVSGAIPACACIHNFQVADVDAKYKELAASGARFLQRPQKLYWGYGAELADPDGHVLRRWDERSMREKGS
jgi:catechol 2,3-dioxygenase-like lactoylglutathione lyase family enzyme